jgi:adhesin transport system membrane fusion protein
MSRRSSSVAMAERVANPNRASSILLLSIFLSFLAFFVWAALWEIEEATLAEGRIVPSAKVQVVQSLEGGIVKTIHVRQGDSVKEGDLLVSLSTAQAGSDYESRRQQALALSARVVRLTAEVEDKALSYSDEFINQARGFVDGEVAVYRGRAVELRTSLAVLDSQFDQRGKEMTEARVALATSQRLLALGREERAILADLVARRLEPRLELIRLDRALAEQEGRVESSSIAIQRLQSAITEIGQKKDATLAQFKSGALSELSRSVGELRSLQETLPGLVDKVDRSELRAPMNGIVNRVLVTTVSGVIKPGEPIVEIVPGEDKLVVEARVSPQDIGFVRAGQRARIRLTAYDFAIFGSLDGAVSNVGADAVVGENGDSAYLVRIESDTPHLESFGRKLPIIPGMVAQSTIITGSRTILTYLTKPVVRTMQNAFRER